MKTYFKVKAKYNEKDAFGCLKPKKNMYLVDAVTFTEAEKRIVDELTMAGKQDIVVTMMQIDGITDVWAKADSERLDDRWWKVRVAIIDIEEKRTYDTYMVRGTDAGDVMLETKERMGTDYDYEVVSLMETSIEDVFFYEEEGVTDETR